MIDWVGKAELEATVKDQGERIVALEKRLEGTEDFNLASVIHNFRYKIEEHSRLLSIIKKE